jgi:hypothetical protein
MDYNIAVAGCCIFSRSLYIFTFAKSLYSTVIYFQSLDPTFHLLIKTWFAKIHLHNTYAYTAISIRVVHEQSGKVEFERERLLGIALKIH